MIVFTDKTHQYFDESTKKEYTSVSKIVSKYKNKFDKEFHSRRSAISILIPEIYSKYKKEHGWDNPNIVTDLAKYVDPLELGLLANCFKQQWLEKNKQSTDKGTLIHSLLENNSYKFGGRFNPRLGVKQPIITTEKEYDNQSITENLRDLKDGYYAELLVFSNKYKIAGQIDGCFVSTGKAGARHIDIIDYKTDKEILKKPKFFNKKTGYPKMLGCLSHLYDCNYSIYSIKMSMYGYLLEAAGFEIKSLTIIHYSYVGPKKRGKLLPSEHLGSYMKKEYQLPYKRDEIKKIIKNL